MPILAPYSTNTYLSALLRALSCCSYPMCRYLPALKLFTLKSIVISKTLGQNFMYIVIIIIIIIVMCHRHFFLVLPLLHQRSTPSLRLQFSHCSRASRITCDVPITAVLCTESTARFPVRLQLLPVLSYISNSTFF